jgi:hypothetical protein
LNKTSELINNLLSGNNNSNLSSLDIEENIINSVVDTSVDNSLSCVNNDNGIMKGAKGSQHHKYKLHLNSGSDEDATCNAVNTNLKFTKSLDNVTDGDFKPTSSPKLSYSRAKLLSNQQLKSPTHSPKFNEKCREVTFSSDSKLNASPSSKHRPLSAASISSSSSSTSTASSSNSFVVENLVNGKLGMTYLASIESLADNSENECNPSLTMCERAVLEIIDSEKSYVEDLGQIIRGCVEVQGSSVNDCHLSFFSADICKTGRKRDV